MRPCVRNASCPCMISSRVMSSRPASSTTRPGTGAWSEWTRSARKPRMAKPTTKVSSIAWSHRGDTSMGRRDPLLMKPLPGLNQTPCATTAPSQEPKRSLVRTLVRLIPAPQLGQRYWGWAPVYNVGMQPVSCVGCQALQRRLHDLQAENERLRRQLDEAKRAGKRQAAPFAKGQPTNRPKKPGRKPGKDYGTKANRQPPNPEQIDEVHEAPLPHVCPDCGGPLDETHTAQQFQIEIPRKPIHRQFNIHVGQRRRCHRRVQGR